MSYLCGPLTRQQIKTLVGPLRTRGAAPARRGPADPSRTRAPRPASGRPARRRAGFRRSTSCRAIACRPVRRGTGLPGCRRAPFSRRSSPRRFSRSGREPGGAQIVYQPGLLGIAAVRYVQMRGAARSTPRSLASVDAVRRKSGYDRLGKGGERRDRCQRRRQASRPRTRCSARSRRGRRTRRATARGRGPFADTLYRTRRLELFWCPRLKLASRAGESERDFRVRLSQSGRERPRYAGGEAEKEAHGQVSRARRPSAPRGARRRKGERTGETGAGPDGDLSGSDDALRLSRP